MEDQAGFNYGEKNTMAPTFLSVAKQNVKIGDIKLENSECNASTLIFLNKNGATEDVTEEMIGAEAFAEYPTAEAAFIYVNPDEASDWGCDAGWYLWADYEATAFPLNDIVTLKKGQGFVFEIYDPSLKIIYAGEVDQGIDGEIALPYNYGEKNVIGNVTPVPLTIGDLVLNNSECNASTLIFLNKNGATEDVTEEMIGAEAFAEYPNAEAAFIYVNPDEASDWGCDAGWYLWADYEATAFPLNDIVKLPAGKAFIFEIYDPALEITLPSPVKPVAK